MALSITLALLLLHGWGPFAARQPMTRRYPSRLCVAYPAATHSVLRCLRIGAGGDESSCWQAEQQCLALLRVVVRRPGPGSWDSAARHAAAPPHLPWLAGSALVDLTHTDLITANRLHAAFEKGGLSVKTRPSRPAAPRAALLLARGWWLAAGCCCLLAAGLAHAQRSNHSLHSSQICLSLNGRRISSCPSDSRIADTLQKRSAQASLLVACLPSWSRSSSCGY
jgi:hypothetical protein